MMFQVKLEVMNRNLPRTFLLGQMTKAEYFLKIFFLAVPPG